MDFGQQLSATLRERRRQLGLSQAELARRAGMTQPGISRVELGDTTPTLPLLARLAEALEADLEIRLAPLDRTAAIRLVPRDQGDAAEG
jgi:transcriptional regulator with XRE-family HTH domain